MNKLNLQLFIVKYNIPEVKLTFQRNNSGVATIAAANIEKAINILQTEGQFKDSGDYQILHVLPIPGIIYEGVEVLIDETYLSFEDEN